MNFLKMRLLSIKLFLLLTTSSFVRGQKIDIGESIAWYNLFTTAKFNNKYSAHFEYQWRRVSWGRNWQQSLLRLGLNYTPKSYLQFRIGYGEIETFPYDDIPINAFGKRFTEHRTFQMVQLKHAVSLLELTHRFMLEQRFIGKYSHKELNKEDAFTYSNRFRYMLRLQTPLGTIKAKNNFPIYAAVYDEVFIRFGKNVQPSMFDQNRLGGAFGIKVNQFVSIEFGYLNQLIQFGRLVDNKIVMQHNHGVLLNLLFNLEVQELKKR